MNIQHLRCFVIVGECLNFSEAAKRLFITQPNLSQIIISLERQIGTKLFIRNTKSVKMTRAGEILMPTAVEIVEKYDKTIRELDKLSSMHKDTLRIGYLGTVFNRIFPECIPRFQSEHPTAKLTLQRFDPNYFCDAFDNDIIDIGFSHRIDVENINGLHYKKLFDVYLTVVVHKDNPLAKFDCVDLITIKEEPLIVPLESFSPNLYRKIIKACEARNFSPQISQMAQSIEVYFQMIDSKMGSAILPGSCRYLNYPNVKIIKIRDNEDLNVEACFVWKHSLSHLATGLLKLVENYVSKSVREE